MAENNPIKYSDLIKPDDSIETLIKQLDEANDAYQNLGNSVKQRAQTISIAMGSVTGATAEGRNAIKGYSEEAQKLIKAERDLNFARSETAHRIAELKAMKKDEQTITKLTTQLNRSEKGSYDALSAQYSLNKIRLNAMTQAERENTEVGRKLEAETAAIYAKMNELQKATGKYTLQVGNYELACGNLKQELKDLKMQLAAMEAAGLRGSDAYEEMAKKAGALQDHIEDASREIRHYASDTRLLDDGLNILQSAAAGWQVYQGAVNAFGIESEEAMKAMAKLQGIIAMTNGLQKLSKQFTDNATATYKVYHGILRLVGLEKKAEAASTIAATTAEGQQTAAVEANTAANVANATSISAVNVALKAFKVALITTGIGAFVVAIGALIAYWDDIKEFFTGLSKEAKAAAETQQMLADATENSTKEYAKAQAEMSVYQDRINRFVGTKEQEKKLVQELNDKYGTALGKYETLNEWKERLRESGEAYCKTLQREAEMQALLSAYQDVYLQKMQAQRKYEEGGYSHWYLTKAGEAKAYKDELAQLDKRLQNIDTKMKKVAAEKDFVADVFNINTGSSTTETKTKTTKSKTTKETTEVERQQKVLEQIETIRKKTTEINISLIEDEFARETSTINNKYKEQIDALRAKGEKEVELREAINEQIKALETKQQMELADAYTKHADKMVNEQAKMVQAKREAAEKVYKTELDAINKETELQQLLISNQSVNAKKKEELSLQAEKERLKKIYALNVQAGKDITSLEMQTLLAQINAAEKAIQQAKKPQDLYDVLGLSLNDDQKKVINDSFAFALDQLNGYLDAWAKAADKKVELAQKEVDSAQAALNAEREARANGYAANVEYAQKNLDAAKANQQKALREQEKAQKAQAQLATIQQATNLVSASALIWSQLGFPWAIPAIAVMWGSFAASKIKASQVTQSGAETYGEGTIELLQGGSHQSGNDVDLGRKKDGTRRRAEGGEFFAVINKRNSRKYRSIIPDIITSLNNGTFEAKYGDIYNRFDTTPQAAGNSVDISGLSRDVSAIRKQGETRTYTDNAGTHVWYKNVHRLIRN